MSGHPTLPGPIRTFRRCGSGAGRETQGECLFSLSHKDAGRCFPGPPFPPHTEQVPLSDTKACSCGRQGKEGGAETGKTRGSKSR